jgi:hypothetical protein
MSRLGGGRGISRFELVQVVLFSGFGVSDSICATAGGRGQIEHACAVGMDRNLCMRMKGGDSWMDRGEGAPFP